MPSQDVTAPQAANLMPVGRLFSESWRFYKARWGLLMTVMAIGGVGTLLAVTLPVIVGLFLSGLVVWIMIGLIAVTAALWAASWGQVAIIEATFDSRPEPMTAFNYYKDSWSRITGFSWVYILFFVLVISGLFVFLIPGLFLGVALAFGPFIAIDEGMTGMEALEKSWYYVQGRWFPVFGRLILILAVATLPAMIPMVGWVIELIFAPLPLVFVAVLYRDLKATRAAEPFVPSFKTKLLLASAILGLALPTMAAIGLVRAVRRYSPQLDMQSLLQDPAAAQKWLSTLQKASGLSPEAMQGLSP